MPAGLRVPPVARAAAAQVLGWLLAALATPEHAHPALVLCGHSAAAAAAGLVLGLPRWWVPINAAFPCLVAGAIAAALPPLWYLLAFGAMAAVYWSTYRTQVPLYLSSARAVAALSECLPKVRACRFLDLGCGTGTVLAGLAGRASREVQLAGVELAPLPYAIARVRAWLGGRRFTVARRDFWTLDLASFDIVYAFLSPVPMPALWQKARREMRPGTLLISNTFAVPGVAPDEVITLGRHRSLYLWRMP